MRIKKIVLLLFIFVRLYGWEDSDMDGVSNIDDLCPNTKFEYLVDNIGCPIDGSIGKLSLILGSNINIYDSISSQDYNFFIKYSYKLWALSLYTSQESTDSVDLSTGDLYISLHYNIIGDRLSTKLSLGAKIAIGDDEISTGEHDYFTSINLKYLISSNLRLMSNLNYTITGDNSKTSYKNPIGYSLGLGYNMGDKWYMELYYQNSNSIYEGSDDYSSISISGSYNFTDNIWATIGYTNGLDNLSYSDIFSLKVGVSFE